MPEVENCCEMASNVGTDFVYGIDSRNDNPLKDTHIKLHVMHWV